MSYDAERDKVMSKAKETFEITDALMAGAVKMAVERISDSPARANVLAKLVEARCWLEMAVDFSAKLEIDALGQPPDPSTEEHETDPSLT